MCPPDRSAHPHCTEHRRCHPLPVCHACTLWAEHTTCAPPSPETTPHSTASEGFIGTCSQAELPCPWLGCTDPFLGTLPAPRAQTGQLQPSAARLCRSIQGSGMPGGLGVPIILPSFLAPGHPDRARQATACPLLSLSPQPGKHTYGAERVGASLELHVEDICKPAHTWSVRASMRWSVVGVCKDTCMCLGTCCAKGPRWVTLGKPAGCLPAATQPLWQAGVQQEPAWRGAAGSAYLGRGCWRSGAGSPPAGHSPPPAWVRRGWQGVGRCPRGRACAWIRREC